MLAPASRARQRQPRALPPGHVWPGSGSAVEAELDHAGGDQARALAAGVAGDVELGGERVEAALGGALADVERLGELGAGGGTAGEGALAAVGRDQGRGGRPLLLGERDRGLARRDVAPALPGSGRRLRAGGRRRSATSPSRRRRGRSSGSPLSAVPLRLSRSVAISTPPRLSISRWFQETASSSMRTSASGSRPTDGPLRRERHRARLAPRSRSTRSARPSRSCRAYEVPASR